MIVHRLDGEPADAAGLARTLVNYGHFTSMQVRGGAVRGLSLHLARLQAATTELFDTALDVDAVRGWMAAAAGDLSDGDGALRVLVFPRAFDLRDPGSRLEPQVLVTAQPPATAADTPLRVRAHAGLRPLPHLKHVATFPLFDAMRRARRAGFDDALLVTPAGQVAEGSTWNIVFEDADGLVWPDGPMLDGITQQLVRAGARGAGSAQRTACIALADLPMLRAACALNALGVRPIGAIDGHAFADPRGSLARVRALLEAMPYEPLAGATRIV